MAEAKPRYTYCKRKGGKAYWYFRHPMLDNTALPGHPGVAEFHARYAELLALVQGMPSGAPARSTFAWLINEYSKSAEFTGLSEHTKDDYRKTLELIRRELGDQPFGLTTRRMIKAVRDSYSSTPRKADKIRQMASRLYSWADEAELVPAKFNPASGLKRLKHSVKAIEVWSDEEIELLLSQAPAHIVTPVMLQLYTGQRRADVVKVTWQQFMGRTIRVRQSKTGKPLDLPCHPRLYDHLNQLKRNPRRGVVIATSIEHRAYTPNSYSQALARAIEQIEGMPKRSTHGLRYAAAARLEAAGATVSDISAVLGHETYEMALYYINQRRAAERAMQLLEQQL